ncbi:MAG: hypothetical protein ACE5M4_15085 [Anaerolineales bacterium]
MNLKAIVRAYIRQIRPRAEAELEWFRSQPSIKAAIEHAALAINSRGKRYSHQCRLRKKALEEVRTILLTRQSRLAKAQDFEELFDLVRSAIQDVTGIGDLYVYDTSLRLGARLNLEPTKVYLHSGTRIGARALGLDGKAESLRITELPKAFRELRPHEIEDVLCIFKDKFKKPVLDLPGRSIRSWCN